MSPRHGSAVSPGLRSRAVVGTLQQSWKGTGIWRAPLCDGGFYDDLRAVAAGRPWSVTKVYSDAIEGFKTGSPLSKEYADIHDWESRGLGEYDRLLSSIRTSGYLSQTELSKRRPTGYVAYKSDEVTVAIGRDGSLLLWEGRHRVAWATVLEVERIPVQIMFRHPDWIAVRRRVAAHVSSHGGRAPQPLLHPDLNNVPAATDCAALFAAVRGSLSFEGGTLIDFSPGWGYYCHRFENLGFACTAVLEGEDDRWFLHTLRIAEDRSFALVDLGDRSLSERTFDVAIALGWHRAGSSDLTEIHRLMRLVRETEYRELIVEVPDTLPASQDGTCVSAESLLDVLSSTGEFSVTTPILNASEGSRLYRLVKHEVTAPSGGES